VLLLDACVRLGLPVVSSMGAGGRLDGAQVLCGDLDETRICPLARVLRQRLHRRGIRTGITCVYSVEPARNTLPHDPADAGEHHGTGRPRTPIGTISYLPALFGLRIAQEVIERLTGAAGAAGSPPGPPETPGCS
jgi:tRNA A37 threonylcarbamoyladenosine dehydratase